MNLLDRPELTERIIKEAPVGAVLKDHIVRGLHVRVFEGSRSFYMYYRAKSGVQRKPKLGEVGSITLVQARKVAQELMTVVAAGRDPVREREMAKAAPDTQDLWDVYWKRHGAKKKSGDQDLRNWNVHIAPRLARVKLADIDYTLIANIIEDMGVSPYAANRVLSLLSKMFSFAYRPLEWVEKNPCIGVARYTEVKRKRYMVGDEASRIAELLDAAAVKHPASVAFIYLLILTGARKSEIAGAKWAWLVGNVLRLPDSKTGAKSVYIPPQAMSIIDRLPRTGETVMGIVSPKKLWERVRREAGCSDLRLHDLRHSFASAALTAGLSLAQIGELLGHKSTQTTKRYAHLAEDVACAAARATADVIMVGMNKAPSLDQLDLRLASSDKTLEYATPAVDPFS